MLLGLIKLLRRKTIINHESNYLYYKELDLLDKNNKFIAILDDKKVLLTYNIKEGNFTNAGDYLIT